MKKAALKDIQEILGSLKQTIRTCRNQTIVWCTFLIIVSSVVQILVK
jgi:uncharacterized membrane protein